MSREKTILFNLLENALGNARNNYKRASAAFNGSDLSKEYGESGKTKRQILDEYWTYVCELEQCVSWLTVA